MAGMFSWWVDLFTSGAMGAVVAIVLAAFAVLLVGNAVIWSLAGLKRVFSGKPQEPTTASVDTASGPA